MASNKPCYKCEKRHFLCHADCEEYKRVRAAPEPELEPVRQKATFLLETLKKWNTRYAIEPQIMITERGGEFKAYLPGVAQVGCSWEKATSIVIGQLAAMSTIAQGLKLLSEQYPEYVSVSGREES